MISLGVVAASILLLKQNRLQFGAGVSGSYELTGYNAIGSSSSPSTLSSTTTYSNTSSSALMVKGMPNIAFAVQYTPKSYGSSVYILLERSIDNGATFFPYGTLTTESADTLVNSSGTRSTAGTPFVIPGNDVGTATSGTTIKISWDLSLVADYIRLSAKESTTSTFGTLSTQVKMLSN